MILYLVEQDSKHLLIEPIHTNPRQLRTTLRLAAEKINNFLAEIPNSAVSINEVCCLDNANIGVFGYETMIREVFLHILPTNLVILVPSGVACDSSQSV